jgi:hypothetical protein
MENTLAQGVALMKKMFGVDVDHRCGCPLTTGSRHDGWGAVLFADRVDCKQIMQADRFDCKQIGNGFASR